MYLVTKLAPALWWEIIACHNSVQQVLQGEEAMCSDTNLARSASRCRLHFTLLGRWAGGRRGAADHIQIPVRNGTF